VPTEISQDKLIEHRNRLPKRLHTFLDNFFGTCQPYDPEVNYANYLNDIRLYGMTVPVYRQYAADLVVAFYEITGWRPD